LTYLQKISDFFSGGALHIEPGTWITQPSTTYPAETAPPGAQLIARLGTIPHGNSLLAQGIAEPFSGPPTLKTPTSEYAFSQFPSFNSTPFGVGTPINAAGSSDKLTAPPPGFTQYDLTIPASATNPRTPFGTIARKHLKVSRQRKDFAVKTAKCVVKSNDLVAYEDLMVRNMVKNHAIAKSISDASWSLFREWVEYFGKVFGVVTVAVPPHFTSQNCSNCREVVKKSLSTRTHVCPRCGLTLDRDWNAARSILEIGLRTVGHTGTLIASGDIDLCMGGEIPPSKSGRGKRKPKE
jgi:IS605 OrfB family transposase